MVARNSLTLYSTDTLDTIRRDTSSGMRGNLLAMRFLRLLNSFDHAATDLACLLEAGCEEVCVVSLCLSLGDRLGLLAAEEKGCSSLPG